MPGLRVEILVDEQIGGDGARDPSEVEMRWEQFAGLTMGYTMLNSFTLGGGGSGSP